MLFSSVFTTCGYSSSLIYTIGKNTQGKYSEYSYRSIFVTRGHSGSLSETFTSVFSRLTELGIPNALSDLCTFSSITFSSGAKPLCELSLPFPCNSVEFAVSSPKETPSLGKGRSETALFSCVGRRSGTASCCSAKRPSELLEINAVFVYLRFNSSNFFFGLIAVYIMAAYRYFHTPSRRIYSIAPKSVHLQAIATRNSPNPPPTERSEKDAFNVRPMRNAPTELHVKASFGMTDKIAFKILPDNIGCILYQV